MTDITKIIEDVAEGRANATRDLLPLIYDNLRMIANSRLSRESNDHTLQPTALVHEAYMKLIGDREDNWKTRNHFFAAASEAMRRILIDHARTKKRLKRGGGFQRIDLGGVDLAYQNVDDLLALNDALNDLELLDEPMANLVKLRFFGGMTMGDVAKALGMSQRTAERNWSYARAWLRRQLEDSNEDQDESR